jgi:hypothetical protein
MTAIEQFSWQQVASKPTYGVSFDQDYVKC